MSFKEWKEVEIQDISDVVFSGGTPSTKKSEYWDGSYNWLSSGETRNRFITDTEKKITKDGIENSSTKLAKIDDIVIASAGQGNTRGQTSICKIDTYINQSLIAIRANKEIVNPYYLFYNISSRYDELRKISDGHSIRGSLTTKIINSFKVKLPSIEEQKAIANILSDLDNKIEVNNKINKNLEDMAQAIFKHWFVDFEFPNDEGKPYKSSRGEMVDSELGMIPKGWEVGVFRNYITNILGGDWGKEQPQGNYLKEVYCMRGADIPELNKGNKGKSPERFILEKNFNNKKLTDGDLIVEISGGSPTQSTGRIAYINKSVLDKFDKGLVCTNFCRAMTLKDRKLMEFVYIYWTYLYDLDVFFQFENGTTGIKNLDINNFLDRNSIINPPKELIDKFYDVVNNLFIMIQQNGKENEKLSNLRDTLLPKLMSGEIRVPID